MAVPFFKKKSLPLLARRRLRWVATIVAAVPMLTLAMVAFSSATPASAGTCPLFALCTWQNANFSGTQWNFTATSGQPAGFWWYVGNAQNDQISSIINEHDATKAWFNKDCPAGSNFTWIGSEQEAPNLANNKWPDGTSMNDSISAWGLGRGTGGDQVPAHGSRPAGGC
jgi:hypothetical protein